MEKQVLAIAETERIPGQDSMSVHTPVPVYGWFTGDAVRANVGIAQAATHWKWKRYLQQ